MPAEGTLRGVLIKYWAYWSAALLIGLMVGAAQLVGQKEVIFPEITALAVGAWVAPHQPWRVDRIRLWLVISTVALSGVLIVRYLPVPQVLQLCIGVAIAAVLLTVTRTTIFPAISACALPVLLQTESWIYPLSVVIFALAIAAGQFAAERLKLHEPVVFQPVEIDRKKEFVLWLKRLGLIFLIALPLLHFGWIFCIAPPLLVAFTELTNSGSPARKRGKDVVILTTICAVIGTVFRFGAERFDWLPLWAAAALGVLLVLCVMRRMKLFMPPSGAIGTLPMLIEPEYLLFYPLEICIGIVVLTAAALLCFRDQEPAR